MAPKKRKPESPTDWKEVCDAAKRYRNESLREADSILADHIISGSQADCHQQTLKELGQQDYDITSLNFADLKSGVRDGKLSAVSVVRAYLRRAIISQHSTNCLTELLPNRALNQAANLDERQRGDWRSQGPLYGIPFSVKECLGLKGLRLHSGYVAFWEKIADDDALVVKILVQAGAIPFARTTEPQSMMSLETDSNLYGVTTNAFGTDLSAGGSSGGEGALIGTRGSILGIGSDIGGSIRVPAAVNGLYGFKPSAFRIPTTGWSSTPPGADSIATVVGPMSSSLDAIDAFMQTVIAAKPWLREPALLPMPWNPITLNPSPISPLRIGIMYHDEVVIPHPPVTRGLKELVERISRAIPDIVIVPFKAYKHDEGWAIASSLYFTDGGESDLRILKTSGEPIRPLVNWMIKCNPCVKKLTREQLEYWNEEREEYRLEYARHWNETGQWDEQLEEWTDCVDAVICPVAPWVAAKHNTSKYWAYTALWNLLDFSAIAFGNDSIGKADKVIDARPTRNNYISDVDKEIWESYDADAVDGLPLAIQIICRRLEDEKVLAIARWIQERLPKNY